MKVSDLVRIKENIKLDNGTEVESGSVGIIIDIVINSKSILYKVHIPGITYTRVKGYYFTRQNIAPLNEKNRYI